MKIMNVVKFSIVFILIVSITGCGNNENAYKESIQELEVKIEQLKDEKESLEAIVNVSSKIQSEKNEIEKEPVLETTEETKAESNELQLGDTIAIEDVLEFSLLSCEWGEKVTPSNTEKGYSYYDGAEGETYIIIRGTLKNLSTDTIDIRNCQKTKLLINDKYNIDASMVCEGPDGDDLDKDPKPLQTLNLIIYSSISNELKEQFEKGEFTINITSDQENINKRFDVNKPYNIYTLDIILNDFNN